METSPLMRSSTLDLRTRAEGLVAARLVAGRLLCSEVVYDISSARRRAS